MIIQCWCNNSLLKIQKILVAIFQLSTTSKSSFIVNNNKLIITEFLNNAINLIQNWIFTKFTMLNTEKVISTNLTIDTELDSIEMQLGKCSFLFNLVMQAKLFPNEWVATAFMMFCTELAISTIDSLWSLESCRSEYRHLVYCYKPWKSHC